MNQKIGWFLLGFMVFWLAACNGAAATTAPPPTAPLSPTPLVLSLPTPSPIPTDDRSPTPNSSELTATPTWVPPSPTALPQVTSSPTVTATLPISGSVPSFDHIFVILEENRSYAQIVGEPSAPYINSLIQQYALAPNYFAISHPSTPNYLALIGGGTFGIQTDCPPSVCPVSQASIVDNIEAAGKTWKAYMESMPTACKTTDAGRYAVRHDPFVYFTAFRNDAARCRSHIVPYTALAGDLAQANTTPSFVWISPDLCGDMHDCTVGVGDAWLKKQLPAIFASPAWNKQTSALFLVWDEDDYGAGNHVAALVMGTNIKAGYRSPVAYTHYSLLRTIESAWGLAPLTSLDATAAPMADFWK